MEKPLILVADAESKNLQILRDSLESSGFSVVVANDGLVAWEKIQSEHPDLILSELNLPNFDGFQLLEKLKEDPNTSTIPVMFLTNRRDVQDRVRSLRGGVKDYMIKPLHVKEVIARVRMILRRISRVQPENSDSEKKMAGRIEEYSVIELIDNFGANRKSGVLQLYNEQNRNGEIWFKAGAVIHASFGTLKAEKAVYQMLPWQHGHFIMTFKEVNVPETINVSNLGLLLHGYKRMELREQFFKQLPSPETTFVLSEEFRDVISKKELSQEASKFLALIDGRRDIMQIVDESVYDDLQTLERLAKLHKQKFIKPGKAADQTSTEINISAIKSEIFTDDLEETPESLPVQEEHFSEPENTPAAPDEPKEMQDAIDESEEVTTQSQPKMDFPDFPPPDFDALDIEDEEDQQHNRFRRNGVRDHTFASRDKMAKDDHNEEPQTEELRQSPDKSFLDHFDLKSTLKKSERISEPPKGAVSNHQDSKKAEKDSQNHQSSASPIRHAPEIRHDSEDLHDAPANDDLEDSFEELDHEPKGFQFPEPLQYREFAPGMDISNPFAHYQDSSHELDLDIEDRSTLKKPYLEPSQREDQQSIGSHSFEPTSDDEQELLNEPAEAKADNAPAEEKIDSKKQTYSFPLRSYGRPRFDKKQPDDEEIPASNPHPESTHLRIESEPEIEKSHRQTEPQIPGRKPDLFQPSVMPKPPQIQRAKPVSEPEKPSQQESVKSKTFADIEHIIARQRAIQAEKPQIQERPAQEPKPAYPAYEEIGRMLQDYFSGTGKEGQKFMLIGSDRSLIESFSDYIMNGQSLRESQSNIFQYFAAGERSFDDGSGFATIGVTMEKQFTQLLEKLANNLAGYVLLIDASETNKLNYIAYLHTVLKNKFHCPRGIAIFDSNHRKNFALDTIKDLIGATPDDLIMKLELSNDDDHVHFLREVLNGPKKDTDHR